MHDECNVYERMCYLHMYGPCLTHAGLRCEVRGLGYDSIILAQLRYEHEFDARQRSGDILSQVVADLNEASPLLPRPTF